jgi:protein TonB
MLTISQTDPIADVLGRARSDRMWMGAMLGVAACVHAGVASSLAAGALPHLARGAPLQLVDVDLSPRAAPVAAPAESSPQPASIKSPPSRTAHVAPPRAFPAQAATVLTQPKAPNDVLDLTDGFVTGSAPAVVSGVAASQGGSAPGRTGGSTGGPPVSPPGSRAPVLPGADRSRKPALAGDHEWRCPFPSEADSAGIDAAVVALRVDVTAAGGVRNVSIESDPGHGFGYEARRCALTQRWTPALDRDGNAVDGGAVIRVRFER